MSSPGGRGVAARQGGGASSPGTALASRNKRGSSGASALALQQQQAMPAELQVIQNPHHFGHNVGVVYFL
jgi:hypothetical protein